MKLLVLWMVLAITNCFVKGEIEMVALIFRHGHRTPIATYPNDIYKNYDYNGLGLNALTPKGIRQMYDHGARLRIKYKSLFTKDGMFRNYNLEAKCTHIERTLMSGLSFLAGFYPPESKHNSLPNNWQPIPVYPLDADKDYLIWPKACQKSETQIEHAWIDPPERIKQLLRRDKEMVESFQVNGGYMENFTFKNFIYMFDIIKVQSELNLPVPKWFKPEYWSLYKEYTAAFQGLFTGTEELTVFQSGAMFTEIINTMGNVTNNPKPKRILIYSGHDITISSLITALKINTQLPIDYGSTVALELHKNENKHEVKIYYYESGHTIHPVEISIPKCPKPCLLHRFKNIYHYLIVKNITEMCKLG